MMANIAVLVTDQFEDIELTSPEESLKNEGHTLTIISEDNKQVVTGKHGTEYKVDQGIEEAIPSNFDGLLLPGGFSPDLLRGDEKGRFGLFTKHFLEEDKPSFAICHGPQLLIDTDLLQGKQLTSFISVRKDLKNAGAQILEQPVVIDGNIITSRTPDDLNAFNEAIINSLK
ncbi:type 1 glutamine amidotransferase domain-containing protein [Staphylococcus succinus]|uniref:type 1 glutamine amidotransferase domain-containing protein n=1 Tax=Staphylococcus succinus TaxID=61015 RepID=UPI000D1E64FC|nr:type 1 glutamine amidotransferase domain-containing protein [Staphylococcus succinus]PTJ15433.1 protease [Staphylococcus succinus]RIN27413.1 type 1 glutamine amidotransferase [Staphylococcus succinus]